MRNSLKVYLFELKVALKSKAFYVMAIIMALLIIGASLVPSLLNRIGTEGLKDFFVGEDDNSSIGIYFSDKETNIEELKKYLPENTQYFNNEQDLTDAVNNEIVNPGVEITGNNKYKAYYKNRSIKNSAKETTLKTALISYNRDKNIEELGYDAKKVEKAIDIEIESSEVVLGKDAVFMTPILTVLLVIVYMYYLTYGQLVASSVAKEKSDKTMEILITSTSPTSLIIGKVFASATIGTLAMLINLVFVLIGALINKKLVLLILESFDFTFLKVPTIFFFVYLILGYFLYLFIYAGLGALVSKIEEVGQAVGVLTMLIVVGYIAAIVGMQNPQGALFRIVSIIPFTSPFSMFIRVALIDVPFYDMILSLGFMILFIVIFSYISIKIYRMGTLNYGNKIKLRNALKSIIKKEA